MERPWLQREPSLQPLVVDVFDAVFLDDDDSLPIEFAVSLVQPFVVPCHGLSVLVPLSLGSPCRFPRVADVIPCQGRGIEVVLVVRYVVEAATSAGRWNAVLAYALVPWRIVGGLAYGRPPRQIPDRNLGRYR